jgi:hypothetical protein
MPCNLIKLKKDGHGTIQNISKLTSLFQITQFLVPPVSRLAFHKNFAGKMLLLVAPRLSAQSGLALI